MSTTRDVPAGGYRYVPGVFQYSAGVAANPGFVIERAAFETPLPMEEGFAVAERFLEEIGRPTQALCACELRSPAPFSEGGFKDFNLSYVDILARWKIYGEDANPVARTNVCPVFDPPAAPCLYAFSYTVLAPGAPSGGTFVVAGSGEAPEGRANYRDHIVRFGDTSAEAMRDKLVYVAAEMSRRLSALGFSIDDVQAVRAYSAHDIGHLIVSDLARSGFARHGVTWHPCRPPVLGLETEMDVRRTAREILLFS